jgi:predicted CXXCH cytochrome family protein
MTKDRTSLVLATIAGLLCLSLTSGPAMAYWEYSGCETCHGEFTEGGYTSAQDGTDWGESLMDGHSGFMGGECLGCHESLSSPDVQLNLSGDEVLSKSCVGCHGRDEDVTGNCTSGSSGSKVECGSGAGLRLMHESKVGEGTCNVCHTGDATPVGENVKPYNYGLANIAVLSSCDADSSESQFGPTGLDNDGDGQRDSEDSDCSSSFSINAGMNDAWYQPATAGQGFLVTVFEDQGLLFLAWFTFDVERPAEDVTAILGDPGHRWVVAQGPYEGDTAILDVYTPSGGVFDSIEPPVDQGDPVGTMTIQWHDCSSATLTYDIELAGQGSIPLQRIVPDNVPLCEMLQ